MYGGKCVIPSEYFDASASLQSIEEERCTIVYGVPTMFFDILKHLAYSNYDCSSLEKMLTGAAPIPDNLIQNLKQKFTAELLICYGATETSGGICLGDYTTSSGRPLDHIEIKIVDNNGSIVPINTKGGILCRSPYMFLGYWEDKEKTDEVLDSARWYHTGDIGCMDEDGNICVTGRIKDCIIRGGEKIYPLEIENFLLLHPDISEVYTIGVPDPRLGEQLCCCICMKQNKMITEKDIKDFCIGKISDFKIPKYVLFCESFPKTGSGKIQRFKLQEQCIKLLKL